MGRDVISYVSRQTTSTEADSLEVLLVATDGSRDIKVYRDLDVVRKDFPDVGNVPSKIYRKVSQLFSQGKSGKAKPPGLYRKVKIVGVAMPETPAALVDAVESIRQNDDDWNILLTDRDETAYLEALIAYAESTEPTLPELLAGEEDHRKFYFCQTTDKLFSFPHARAAAVYVNDLTEEGDAAYVGMVAPFYPRRVTWKFKRLDGVTVADLTEGEKDALDEQHVNYLGKEYKTRIYMKEGVCTNGEFIDVVLGADYIAAAIRNNVYDILEENEDVPYNGDGFALIGSGVTNGLESAIDYRIVDTDPASGEGIYTVTLPVYANTTDDQRKSRMMPPIAWKALIQGSIHKADIRGALVVSLQQQETK